MARKSLAWHKFGLIFGVAQVGVDHLLAWKGLGVAAWFALLFAVERWRPATTPHLAEPRGRRIVRNAALGLFNTLLSPLVVVPISVYAAAHALPWRPEWWRGPAGLAVDLLLLDFLIYWWHRANHVVPLLWRFHAVHHYDRFLDTTSAVRFHFGEVLLSAVARAAVIVLLAIPLQLGARLRGAGARRCAVPSLQRVACRPPSSRCSRASS